MTPRAAHVPTIQLNLPLLQGATSGIPEDKQAELILALVELLIGAVHNGRTDGGDDASESQR